MVTRKILERNYRDTTIEWWNVYVKYLNYITFLTKNKT